MRFQIFCIIPNTRRRIREGFDTLTFVALRRRVSTEDHEEVTRFIGTSISPSSRAHIGYRVPQLCRIYVPLKIRATLRVRPFDPHPWPYDGLPAALAFRARVRASLSVRYVTEGTR